MSVPTLRNLPNEMGALSALRGNDELAHHPSGSNFVDAYFRRLRPGEPSIRLTSRELEIRNWRLNFFGARGRGRPRLRWVLRGNLLRTR